MFALTILLFMGQTTSTLTRTETALADNLHQSIRNLDLSAKPVSDTITGHQFEQMFPKSSLPTWQKIQRKAPKYSKARMDSSYLLAYYGVGYEQNVDRMMEIYKLYTKRHFNAEIEEMLDFLTGELDDLYSKQHVRSTLGTLLNLGIDGAGGDGLTELIAVRYRQNRRAVLQAANGSAGAIANILFVLNTSLATSTESKISADIKALKDLETDSHCKDPAVARSARLLLSSLKAEDTPRSKSTQRTFNEK